MYKPIPNYDNYLINENGTVVNTNTGKIIVSSLKHNGYMRIGLCKNGKQTGHMVHRLVMLVFVGPIPEGAQVNHIDGNKTNNSISNLEYVTPQQNMDHASKNLLLPIGARNCNAKLTDRDILDIRKLSHSQNSCEIARRYDMNQATIYDIITGKTWKHVPMEQPPPVYQKGRGKPTKITEDDVRIIRTLQGQLLQREIAQIYGITQSVVSLIWNRKAWPWVPD